MHKLYFKTTVKNITFYTTGDKGYLELAILPLDAEDERFKTFFANLHDLFEPPVEMIDAPYTASDVFFPSGKIRGVGLSRDKYGNVQYASFTVNKKTIVRVSIASNHRISNIHHILWKIKQYHGIPDDSITAILLEVAFKESIKPIKKEQRLC